MSDFAGRHVVVSGGTSGINLGVARHFARKGAKVFVFSRSAEKVAAAVQLLRKDGASYIDGDSNGDGRSDGRSDDRSEGDSAGRGGGDTHGGATAADGVAADVRSHEAVAAAFDRAVGRFGPVDILVSGAAGNFVARARDISSNGFRTVLEIDLLGTHHVMHAAYPHLRKPGASIINVSAAQASVAMVGQAHVSAAKAGVDMLTRTLALEWGPEGVRVNSVLPGPIGDTEGVRRLMPDAASLAAKVATIPLRRMGTTQDVADLCGFLCSPAASYITGTVIPVDGGAILNPQPTRMEAFLDP